MVQNHAWRENSVHFQQKVHEREIPAKDALPGKSWRISCWSQPNSCSVNIHIITTTYTRSTLRPCYFINPIMLQCMSVITTTIRFLCPIIFQHWMHYLPNPQGIKSSISSLHSTQEILNSNAFNNNQKSFKQNARPGQNFNQQQNSLQECTKGLCISLLKIKGVLYNTRSRN